MRHITYRTIRNERAYRRACHGRRLTPSAPAPVPPAEIEAKIEALWLSRLIPAGLNNVTTGTA